MHLIKEQFLEVKSAGSERLNTLSEKLRPTSLTSDERRAIISYLRALETNHVDVIDQIVLYGSSARGEARWESDVDLLIVLTRPLTQNEKDSFVDIANSTCLLYDSVLNSLIFDPAQCAWHARGSSLWLNIQTDGIWLWRRKPYPHPDRNAHHRRFTASGEYRMTEAQYDEIRIHMEHAAEDLRAAQVMIDSHMERVAIGHCYYAAFYAASALLLTKGIIRAKHSGVRGELSRSFFKEKILPPEWSPLYKQLQDEREDATYNMEYIPGEDVAAQRLAWAKEFVEAARAYLVENDFLRSVS